MFGALPPPTMLAPPPVLLQQLHHQNNISVKLTHIPSVINTSNLFTKDNKDNNAHFCSCRDTLMASKSNFNQSGHSVPPHMTSHNNLWYYNLQLNLSQPNLAKNYSDHQNISTAASVTSFERGVLPLPPAKPRLQSTNCRLNLNLLSFLRR